MKMDVMPAVWTPRPCTYAELASPVARVIARAMGEEWQCHRKLWEYVAIARAIREVVEPGSKALGFGVGREPLASHFAAQGLRVVATDQVVGGDWSATAQHASALADLHRLNVCDASLFYNRVAFRHVDMNDIPEDLDGQFDLTWSSCALEHLGSIEKGLAFFRRQMRCLVPGGWAFHTTELAVDEDAPRREEGQTVVFRRSEIRRLVDELLEDGMVVPEPDFRLGDAPEDLAVGSMARPGDTPHLRLDLGGVVTTSFLMVAGRPA